MFDGAKLKEARLAAGFTQDQLAWESKSSQRNIVRWERGHNQPRPSSVQRLADSTGRPVEFFYSQAAVQDMSGVEDALMGALRLLVDRAVRERNVA